MKRGTITILILLALAGFANAKVTAEKLQMAEKAYKNALLSDNAGVRNSALKQIVVVKAEYPEFNTVDFTSVLKKMSNNDDKVYIRVNAKMTLDVLKNKELIYNIDSSEIDPKEFFNGIYTQMNDFYAAR